MRLLPSIPSHPSVGYAGGARLTPALRAINRMFPGYLRGGMLICRAPNDPLWHFTVSAMQGNVLDCTYPTPDTTPEGGAYLTLDCSTENPT